MAETKPKGNPDEVSTDPAPDETGPSLDTPPAPEVEPERVDGGPAQVEGDQ